MSPDRNRYSGSNPTDLAVPFNKYFTKSNKMKNHLFYGLLASIAFIALPTQAQPRIEPKLNPWSLQQLKAYFKIDGRVVNYQGKQYPSVYPALSKLPKDTIASFMHHYPRRFEYLLQNKTEFNDLADWYPDTVRINEAYAQRLAANKPFLTYLSQFLRPLTTPANTRQTTYQQGELMLVASRFFLCDQVRPDTTVSWHICIGLHGMKEANWKKDYTLLEAFCFEAIFDKMFSKNPNDTRYMNQFLKAVDESTKNRRPSMADKEQLLEQVKRDVFQAMQSDNALKKHLLDYYNQHAATLPFKIV
jgi:Txe/YoeB family toxin of Txe-Axe toxin-antitoxin module